MKNRARWLVPSLVIAAVVPAPLAAEEYRGTFEQQLACTPDVFRLCGSEIPDANRIVACLRQNTAQLGDACKAVFQAQNSAAQPPPVNRSSH